MNRTTRALGAVLLSWCAATLPALALCLDGRAPTPVQEAAEAIAVVQARIMQAQDLHEDASDPGGITATRYAVRLLRTLRGQAPAAFSLHSENTSARFPMEVGKRYLLFVSRDGSGRYFIDACGNSAPMSGAQAALKALAARR